MSKADMDMLLDEGIRTAIYFLEKRGEFFPFAVVKMDKGELRHIETLMDDIQPDSDKVLESIKSSLKQAALSGRFVSVAVISNVQVQDQTTSALSDAIRAEIDDKEEEPITCYLPYKIVSGEVRAGQITAGLGNRVIFDS